MNKQLDFKSFLTESHKKFLSDIQKTIIKIPKNHRTLIKDYTFEKQNGNTLKGDGDHVGIIDEKKKKITVAAPWNYSRSFTLLHEVAHAVWKYIMTSKLKEDWSQLIKDTKKDMSNSTSLDQNDEEIFCHTYASVYANHPPTTYLNEKREKFIKNLPN